MGYDFEVCKVCETTGARPRYLLSGRTCAGAKLHVCGACGLHYIDYLDPEAALVPDLAHETPAGGDYVEDYNYQGRHQAHATLLRTRRDLAGQSVLDIGCGSGTFLSLAAAQGARVTGLELYDQAIARARSAGLEVHKYPVEHAFWQDGYRERFDIVTLWDVIEHVNFPAQTLAAAARLLAPGGLLLVSTPCRDAFYHRAGVLAYRLSGGRRPGFLNVLYSNHLYGHKQILSSEDLRGLYHRAGLSVLSLDKVHELSLPYRRYLKRMLKKELLAALAFPPSWLLLRLFRIKNKLIAVGQKG